MSTGQAIAVAVGLIVAMLIVAATIMIAIVQRPVPDHPAPILTILNCPSSCEMMV